MRLVLLLLVATAGCAANLNPTSGCHPFTNFVGLVATARYDGELDRAAIREDLARAGFDLHPNTTVVTGRDPSGDRFALMADGVYEIRYDVTPRPWPDEAAANASWEAVAPRFDASVRAFEDATGLAAAERAWRPDLMSGTLCAD